MIPVGLQTRISGGVLWAAVAKIRVPGEYKALFWDASLSCSEVMEECKLGVSLLMFLGGVPS